MNVSTKQQGAPAAPPLYTCVATSTGLQEALETLRSAKRLALDVEADSLYHYFEKVCLIQISTDSHTFILDPLAIGQKLGVLAPMMADPDVEKVFHAAGYDVFCLRRDYGYTFDNIFDTHLAAQLLGFDQLGLSALLERIFGIAHSKKRQRDDWSRRPLEVEQLVYAAMDTHHLLPLRDVLEGQLEEKNRLCWAIEEFSHAAQATPSEREFDPEGYRRIKSSRELPPRGLAILRSLYLLRDRYAREMDVPSFKVFNNSVMIDLARKPPSSARELFNRKGISLRVARRFAGEIFRVIEKSKEEDLSVLKAPSRNQWKPPSREAKQRLEQLKRWRAIKAEELQLHVGVVFPGNLLETLAQCPPPDLAALIEVQGMRRWRASLFGEDILKILRCF
jgi:ribonuclease D